MIKSIFCVESSKTHLHWKFYYASKSERNVKCFSSIVSFKAQALGVSLCTTLESGWFPLPLSPPLLSTLIWAIFLQIFNIFLLQLFHEENHEILRSWRDQWGPSPDNLGGEKEEDRHQEVGRSQGILGQTAAQSHYLFSIRVTERRLVFSYWFSFFPKMTYSQSSHSFIFLSKWDKLIRNAFLYTVMCKFHQLAKKNRF